MKCSKCGREMVISVKYLQMGWDWRCCDQWCPVCGHEEKEDNINELVREQQVRPYDPNEKPDWEVPSNEETEDYFKVMRRKEEKLDGENCEHDFVNSDGGFKGICKKCGKVK